METMNEFNDFTFDVNVLDPNINTSDKCKCVTVERIVSCYNTLNAAEQSMIDNIVPDYANYIYSSRLTFYNMIFKWNFIPYLQVDIVNELFHKAHTNLGTVIRFIPNKLDREAKMIFTEVKWNAIKKIMPEL